MSLLDQAAADLASILTDAVGGFAVPVHVTDPGERSATVNGLATDIGVSVDPETGLAVAARKASVTLSIAALRAAGFTDNPRGTGSDKARPWRVMFTLPTGEQRYEVAGATMPDKLGCIVCFLKAYG